jgi:lipopolysaccharide export system protein LptC
MHKHDTNTGTNTDWLAPEKRLVSAGSITRYSRIVGSLKLVLPISAACILLVLVVLPNINGSAVEPKQLSAVDASMIAPVYTSHDAQNRPVEIKADSARQQPNAAGVTDLTNPKAVIDLGNGKKLNADANGALYNEKEGSLNVQKGLVLRHSDGTTFTTEEAHIDVNGKNAEGTKPVLLQGNFGEVRGQGFKALEGGKTIIFTGQSSATLKMGSGNKDSGKDNSKKATDSLPSTPDNVQNTLPSAIQPPSPSHK